MFLLCNAGWSKFAIPSTWIPLDHCASGSNPGRVQLAAAQRHADGGRPPQQRHCPYSHHGEQAGQETGDLKPFYHLIISFSSRGEVEGVGQMPMSNNDVTLCRLGKGLKRAENP